MVYKRIKEIEKEDFIDHWIFSENQRSKPDPSALIRIEEHRSADFKYSLIELYESALSVIILPKHDADYHFFKVKKDRTSLIDFSINNNLDMLSQNPNNKCIKSIQHQVSEFQSQIESEASFLERDFIYISPNSKLAVKDQTSQPGLLYAGGFHQLAAYSLLTKERGFYPLRLFLCEYR